MSSISTIKQDLQDLRNARAGQVSISRALWGAWASQAYSEPASASAEARMERDCFPAHDMRRYDYWGRKKLSMVRRQHEKVCSEMLIQIEAMERRLEAAMIAAVPLGEPHIPTSCPVNRCALRRGEANGRGRLLPARATAFAVSQAHG